jgi:vacuolar-type H+-ATPase subunit F/Vma7
MSIYVLGSPEVVAAFALGGMPGRVVEGPDETLVALDEMIGGVRPVQLLAIEESAAESIREEIERLKLRPGSPLVVEVAGFRGPHERRKTPLQFVQEALGIRL